MKLRKTIQVDLKIETPPGFHATRKYRLAFALAVLRDYNAMTGPGMAVAFEKVSGRVYLTTYGLRLTKSVIQGNPDYYRGKKFMCVGQRVTATKTEPIFEMIFEDSVWKWGGKENENGNEIDQGQEG